MAHVEQADPLLSLRQATGVVQSQVRELHSRLRRIERAASGGAATLDGNTAARSPERFWRHPPNVTTRLRILWLENYLDCRVWTYYCDLRRAMAELHTLISIHEAYATPPSLIVVGPRVATGVASAASPLGVMRSRFANVPLAVVHNKLYDDPREFTGDFAEKMKWTRALGAAVGFTWLRTRHAECTATSGVPFYWRPFGVDAKTYGAYAVSPPLKPLPQPYDVGFSGAANAKYPVRLQALAAIERMADLKAYISSWTNGTLLNRKGYVKQLAATKIWISTTGPEQIVGTRYFEVLASGTTLLLCNRPKNPRVYDGLFEDGTHMATFNGTADLEAKVRHYLAHGDERMRIVRAARALVLSAHTWTHRASLIAAAATAAAERHGDGPWYRAPENAAAAASAARYVGCLGEMKRGKPPRNASRAAADLEEIDPLKRFAGAHRGYNVSRCEAACVARGARGFALHCGGFCSGDVHKRARCLCSKAGGGAMPTRYWVYNKRLLVDPLATERAPVMIEPRPGDGHCVGTCSLADERPCGGPSKAGAELAVYAIDIQ